MTDIKLYTDDHIYPITDYTTQYTINNSIMAPYESAQLEIRVPYNLEHDVLPFKGAALDLNTWIVVKENDKAVFWGRVTGASYGLVVEDQDAPAMVAGDVIRLTCESWVTALENGQIYLSGKSFNLGGHIYDLKSWGRILKGLITAPFQNRNLGAVLRRIFNYFAPSYRLPKKLVDGKSLFSIPVIYNKASAKKYAAEREPYHHSPYGLAVNAAQNPTPQGTAWNMVTSAFDVDPNLIELFPSLEPPAQNTGALTKALGATPVLIYRWKPFIYGLNNPPKGENEQVAHPTKTIHYIEASDILNVGLSVSDSDRVNAVYIDTPLNESRGVEAFGLVGTPRLNRDDIDKAGLRMYRGQWPFFPKGKKEQNTSLNDAVQYVINCAYKIMINEHLYTRGTITTRQKLEITQGSWVKLELRHPITKHELYAYVETITHSTRTQLNGDIERRSTLSIVRGFYSGENHHEAES